MHFHYWLKDEMRYISGGYGPSLRGSFKIVDEMYITEVDFKYWKMEITFFQNLISMILKF